MHPEQAVRIVASQISGTPVGKKRLSVRKMVLPTTSSSRYCTFMMLFCTVAPALTMVRTPVIPLMAASHAAERSARSLDAFASAAVALIAAFSSLLNAVLLMFGTLSMRRCLPPTLEPAG